MTDDCQMLAKSFLLHEDHPVSKVITILSNLRDQLGDDATISARRDHRGFWLEVRRPAPAPVLRLVDDNQGGETA